MSPFGPMIMTQPKVRTMTLMRSGDSTRKMTTARTRAEASVR